MHIYHIIFLYHSCSGDENEYMSFSDSRSATSSNIIQPRRLSRGTKRKNSERFSNQVVNEEDDNRFDQLAATAADDSLLLMSNEMVDLFSDWNETEPTPNTNPNNVTPQCPDEKMQDEARIQQALLVQCSSTRQRRCRRKLGYSRHCSYQSSKRLSTVFYQSSNDRSHDLKSWNPR